MTRWGVLSLTEHTEFTELFGAQFRAHRRPPAYRVHRALLPKLAVRFCEIGWLNVSVKPFVFCSSVFFCEKKNIGDVWGEFFLSRWGGFSLTELTDLTEPFCAQFRSHRTPPAYREHRALLPMIDVTLCAICRPQGLYETLCVLFICAFLWEKKHYIKSS